MKDLKLKDGFSGELQINIPREIVINQLRKNQFLGNLFITHIGYFPKAKFHYRERPYGCADTILIYCIEGKGHYLTGNKNYTVLPGHFFILPPGKFHMYQADISTPWTIYWVHFSGNMVKALNNLIKAEDFIAPTKVVYDKRIIEQWNDIYGALAAGLTEQYLTYANLSLYRLLTFFVCPVQVAIPANKKDLVRDSITYMKANIGQPLTVSELAAGQNASASHYAMIFKSRTGSSPIDYFIRLKIKFACQLLKQSDLNIGEISAAVGYDDVCYFSRIFKKMTGSPPSEYRQRVLARQY